MAVDAGKVNTDTGWRGMKVAVFVKREVGEPAAPEDGRALPPPSARTVAAAIEESDTLWTAA